MYRVLYFKLDSASNKRNINKYLRDLKCTRNERRQKTYENEEIMISLDKKIVTAIIYDDKNMNCINQLNNIFT